MTFNMHRSSYSTTPLLYPRAFTDKLQTCQHPGHPIPACSFSFGTAMCSVWNKIEKFILMHREHKQKKKKKRKEKKKDVTGHYCIRNLTFWVNSRSFAREKHEFKIFPFFSDFLSNTSYFVYRQYTCFLFTF